MRSDIDYRMQSILDTNKSFRISDFLNRNLNFLTVCLVVADGRDDFDLVRVDGHLPGRLTPMVFNINTKIVKIEKIKFWEKYKSSYLKFPSMHVHWG